MSMRANILRDSSGNITVQMSGDLDYSNSIPLQNKLQALMDKNPNAKISVDLGGIDFVGSSGICHFVDTIHRLNKDSLISQKISLTNVSDEFKRIFKLYSKEEVQAIWDEFDMDDDSTMSIGQFGSRKRTFEN